MLKPTFDTQDYEKNRLLGSLGYLLFFLPLIVCPHSRYGRYCANQGLMLLVVNLIAIFIMGILCAVLGWVPILGWAVRILRVLVRAGACFGAFYFTINAYLGRVLPLPVIGDLQILR